MTTAVAFDLWRTLVPLSTERKTSATLRIAEALGESGNEGFFRAWRETRRERETSELSDYLHWLRSLRAARWSEDMLDAAIAARREVHFEAFSHLRTGTVETLQHLRRLRVRLGLISNCSSDVRDMLRDAGLEQHFDVVLLSAEVRLMKPDPAIFSIAKKALGAHATYYVGDGDDGELIGASRAGLVDVLLDLGEGRSASKVVTRLDEIPALVREETL